MSATTDWALNTDLSVWYCVSNCGNIVVLQGTYGEFGWDGSAQPFSHGTACATYPGGASTGYCNTSNHRVDFGYVYFNDSYGYYEEPHYGARHEIGHMWGLKHTDDNCVTWSVMKNGECRPPVSTVPSSITQHDKDDINGWY